MLALASDYYKLLSISPDATEREIKVAYRRMAEVYHPDKMRELPPVVRKEGEEIMRLLNEAKSVLLDPAKRSEYDGIRSGAIRPPSEAIVVGEDHSADFNEFVIEEGSREIEGKMKRVLSSMKEVFVRDKGFQIKISEASEIVDAQIIEDIPPPPQPPVAREKSRNEPSEEMTLEFSVVSKGPMKKVQGAKKAKFRIVAVEDEEAAVESKEDGSAPKEGGEEGVEKGEEDEVEGDAEGTKKKVEVEWVE